MTEAQQRKFINHIFRLLKVNELVIPIGRTDKGDLGIKYDKFKEDFIIVLDAVPVRENEPESKELKQLFKKYLFEIIGFDKIEVDFEPKQVSLVKQEKKPRGRPRKVK